MAITPIKKNSISDQIYDQIKENIITGEWKIGTRIPSENELTQMLSVSRVPIREALQRLSALGMIETRQGEGTFVSEPNPGTFMNSLIPMLALNKKSMMDILQYRRIVEAESAALAAQNRDEEDVEAMEKTLLLMKQIPEPCIEFSHADLEFHLNVAKATKNSLIYGAYSIVREILISYYKKINEIMGIERAVKYHTLILEAIKDRDEERARRWMKEHIDTTIDDISYKY